MMAEAADWTMKYFMAASAVCFCFPDLLDVSILQKAKVFISKHTHKSIHEFLDRTISLLVRRVTITMGMVAISVS